MALRCPLNAMTSAHVQGPPLEFGWCPTSRAQQDDVPMHQHSQPSRLVLLSLTAVCGAVAEIGSVQLSQRLSESGSSRAFVHSSHRGCAFYPLSPPSPQRSSSAVQAVPTASWNCQLHPPAASSVPAAALEPSLRKPPPPLLASDLGPRALRLCAVLAPLPGGPRASFAPLAPWQQELHSSGAHSTRGPSSMLTAAPWWS
mmetsp:Transcript_61182/g.145691  ORF Transcript_61182/g.145691 Transcript_61182/m.145691 type:complete len:200 (+) Transcript_61182:129-728(+)